MRYLTWKIRSLLGRARKPKKIRLEGTIQALDFYYARSPFVPRHAYTGAYEPNETQILLSNFLNFKTFINIGANAGWYSLIAAKLGLKTIAIEPDEINFLLLEKNKRLNNLPNLETHQLACSNEEGVAFLYGGNSGSSLIEGWANLPTVAREVRITKFDNLYPASGDSAIIYIDVEGSELAVLQGMTSFLADQESCLMSIEIASTQHHPHSNNASRGQTFALLNRLGFESSYLELNGQLRPYLDWDEQVPGVSFVFTKNYSIAEPLTGAVG
jgi:FkbM family methyltransferase